MNIPEDHFRNVPVGALSPSIEMQQKQQQSLLQRTISFPNNTNPPATNKQHKSSSFWNQRKIPQLLQLICLSLIAYFRRFSLVSRLNSHLVPCLYSEANPHLSHPLHGHLIRTTRHRSFVPPDLISLTFQKFNKQLILRWK